MKDINLIIIIILVDILITSTLTILVFKILKLKKWPSIILSGFALPVALFSLSRMILAAPNPLHHDVPGMMASGLEMLAWILTPVGVTAALVTLVVLNRRALLRRD